jgi:hypothetical protein
MTTEPKKKRSVLKWILMGVAWLVILAALGVWALVRYIKSEDFARDLKIRAHVATGSYIDFTQINWDLVRQLTIADLKMRADKEETPQSARLQTRSVQLDYNWKALLQRKLEFTQFTIEQPSVVIVQKPNGELSLPFIVKTAGKPAPPVAGDAKTESAAPFQVVWPQFDLKEGELVVRRADGGSSLQAKGVNINGRCPMEGGDPAFAAEGKALLKELRLLDQALITNIRGLFNFQRGVLKLSSLDAEAYSGKLTGEVEQHVSDSQKTYNAKLDCHGADVNELLTTFAEKPQMMSGKLDAKTLWMGELGAPEKISGQGTVEIKQGRAINMPIFRQLASLLGNISLIAQPDFSECKAEYTIANQVVDISSLVMKSPMFDLTAKGRARFDKTLEMEGELALNPEALKLIPKEISSAFTDRGDGYRVVPLKVTGTVNEPKVEMVVTSQMINKAVDVIQGLLGGKKKEEQPQQQNPAIEGQPQEQPQEPKPLFDLQKLLEKK